VVARRDAARTPAQRASVEQALEELDRQMAALGPAGA
jgi:hypothetical protein